MTTQKWYKSKVLWVSILSLIGIMLVNVIGFDSELWNAISNVVLCMLTVFGIINSPSVKNGLEATDVTEEGDDDDTV